MITTITGENVPEAYSEGLWCMNSYVNTGSMTRNGNALTLPGPAILEIHNPRQRVLFNPTRDANPFFHVMEFVWMMAGSNDAEWIGQFNKQIATYADDGILRGAYGWRWERGNQVENALMLLRADPNTRQAVINMWDYVYDGPHAKSSDRPCNTHIYFRVNKGALDMTVCNRSNDFFWGMLGSNVVHFTMLQELMALDLGIPIGTYRVFTNNLHVYTDMPGFKEKWGDRVRYDSYLYDDVSSQPLLAEGEEFKDFKADAYSMVDNGLDFNYRTKWFNGVASPMHDAYIDKQERTGFIEQITAPDWKLNCSEWVTRHSS